MEQLLHTGIIFGQSAFNILYNHFNGITNHEINEFHLKFESQQFEFMMNQVHKFKIKRISNCKVLLTYNNIKYFLYQSDCNDLFEIEIMINSTMEKVKIENIIDIQIDVLLGPLLSLRKCKGLDEALMCWSLNKNFLSPQVYIDPKNWTSSNLSFCNDDILNKKLGWFLTNDNLMTIVPQRFINKVRKIHKSKQKNTVDFMDIITNINQYFIKKVHTYFVQEKISNITSFDLNFNIELYGRCMGKFDPKNSRKSLYLKRQNKDDVHFKSLAILFNLRWFFNTINNNQKPFGLDGEYGHCSLGYGQTFHKYDDVILWLVTHPNTVNEVEFVILDPIPPQYILKF